MKGSLLQFPLFVAQPLSLSRFAFVVVCKFFLQFLRLHRHSLFDLENMLTPSSLPFGATCPLHEGSEQVCPENQ